MNYINTLDNFIDYAKKTFGDEITIKKCDEITIKKSDTPDTYEKLFGAIKTDQFIDNMYEQIKKITRLQMEYKEQTLAKIIQEYDFIVGSIECKSKLMQILPEGANIICSPYIESPTMVYAIKKFNVMDLLVKSPESEE